MQLRHISSALALLLVTACGGSGESGPQFAYVTNGVADFWTNAEAGALAGGKEYGVDVTVLMPAGGITDQKNQIEDLITKGVAGIAISPIDPANQIDLIDKACAQTIVITHDSDAPGTKRLAYIGMDNYIAGRMCGELVIEAIPEGGKFAIFDAALPAAGLPQTECAMGISCVIEETGGHKSYWALAHGREAPDFHDPSCFTARLGAASAP